MKRNPNVLKTIPFVSGVIEAFKSSGSIAPLKPTGKQVTLLFSLTRVSSTPPIPAENLEKNSLDQMDSNSTNISENLSGEKFSAGIVTSAQERVRF